jgi:hypothetical protein
MWQQTTDNGSCTKENILFEKIVKLFPGGGFCHEGNYIVFFIYLLTYSGVFYCSRQEGSGPAGLPKCVEEV